MNNSLKRILLLATILTADQSSAAGVTVTDAKIAGGKLVTTAGGR